MTKKSLDAPSITIEHFNEVSHRIHQFLFGFRAPEANVVSFPTLWATLYPLLTYVTNRDKVHYLQRFAYSVVLFKHRIHEGRTVSVWEGSVAPEWAHMEVMRIEPIDPHLPISMQDCAVTTTVLSGESVGARITRKFTRKALAFISKDLGFARPIRNNRPPRKPIVHPMYKSPQDILGFVWYGLIPACEAYPPRYFDIRCTSSMMNYNRSIVKELRDGTTPPRRPALVQPQPGLCTSVNPDVQGDLLQNDAGRSGLEPRDPEPSESSGSQSGAHGESC